MIRQRRIIPSFLGQARSLTEILAAVLSIVLPPHLIAAPSTGQTVQVLWRSDPSDTNKTVVDVIGIPPNSLQILNRTNLSEAQWQTVLWAVAETGVLATDLNLPPMAGNYRVSERILTFVPAFPLEPGVNYRATFRAAALPGAIGGGGSLPVTASHALLRPPAKATTIVSAIYPSASVLPENLLKFYIHFSAPMSRGHIYDNIHLKDAAGKPVELPFLEIDEELWSPNMTRLTLFLDPGRIKRGVRPLEEVGPSLEAGKTYSLEITEGWKDSAGNPLREPHTKTFKIGPADRQPPDPAKWTVESPSATTRSALKAIFPEPLDHALTERVLRVTDHCGNQISGKVSVGAEELSWSFIPDDTWKRGDYQLEIPVTIEDLAGNNIGKVFDVDLTDPIDHRDTNKICTIHFTTK